MKLLISFAIAAGMWFTANAQNPKPVNSIENKVNQLLSKMTLEEKVGQMTQVTLGVVGTQTDGELDAGKLQDACDQS